MNDWGPNGIFLDWPGQSRQQHFSNIEITRSQGKQIRGNKEANTESSITKNVSWMPGFQKDKMEYTKIGLKNDFPKEYGGRGFANAIPHIRKPAKGFISMYEFCLLYTSDAADE